MMETFLQANVLDEQVLVRVLLDGVFPFYNKEAKSFAYLLTPKGYFIGTDDSSNFNAHWTAQLYFLGEGQLTEYQKNEIKKTSLFVTIEKIKSLKP